MMLCCCASTEAVQWLYSAGSSSPSEDRGKLAFPLQNQILFLCAAVVQLQIKLTVLLYTHTQSLFAIYTPLTQQCTPCGHNYREYIAESGVCMPYMPPCGAFDLHTHYLTIYSSKGRIVLSLMLIL